MLSFRQFIQEQIKPMAGDDTGFKEVHEIDHNGEKYHAVVNFVHFGQGRYKVIARTGKPGQVGFKKSDIPAEVSKKVAIKIGRSVDTFRKTHDWNSLSLGGIDRHTKETYQKYARTLEATSNGSIRAQMGSTRNPVAGAVILHNTKPIAQPKLSGHAEPDEHSSYDKKRGQSKYGEYSGTSSHSSGEVKFAPFTGKWGIFNPSGKKKKNSESAASLEASPSSSEFASSSSAK